MKTLFRLAITTSVVAFALILIVILWQTYVLSPWTRDGRVSADVVQTMPEVSGTVLEVAVRDNQFVRRGDVLFRIDPTRFQLAVESAQAEMDARRADLAVKNARAKRRNALQGIVATESIDQANGEEQISRASYDSAIAALKLARLNLERSTVRASVDGFVTNLRMRPGDYATAAATKVAIIDSSSFWITGYFEETKLARIASGMPAKIQLMGHDKTIEGRVVSIGHGIANANDSPNERGLPSVNPVFTWIRLAQRIPVRVQIDDIPAGVTLAAGMTCSIAIGEASSNGRLLKLAQRFL